MEPMHKLFQGLEQQQTQHCTTEAEEPNLMQRVRDL